MNLVLCFGKENAGKCDGVFDLAGWESLRMLSAADKKSMLLTASRIVTDAGDAADMKEMIAVYEDAVAAGRDMYSIAAALATSQAGVFLEWGKLPSDELMKRIGERTEPAGDALPVPKQLIVRMCRGDATDAELADLIGRRIAEVKGLSNPRPDATVALITEGPR